MAINDGHSTDGVPDRGFPLYVVSVVMVIVAGLFVIARLAVRFTKNQFGWDDYTVVAALVFSAGTSITEIEAVEHGYGKHAQSLTHHQRAQALKWFYFAQILYKCVVGMYRISFLCLYLRIFVNKTFRVVCMIGIEFTACCGIAYILATILQCSPVAAVWDRSINGAHCINSEDFWFSYAMINIASDVTILLLPIPQIMRLQLSLKDKLGIIAVFLMGSFVCATTIIRTTTLAHASSATDGTWAPIPPTIWSVIECNTGIICACLPMIRGIVASFLPRWSSTRAVSPNATAGTEEGLARASGLKIYAWEHGYRPQAPQPARCAGAIGEKQDLPDGSSQEHVLSAEQQGRIVKTVEMSVEGNRDSTSSNESKESIWGLP